MKSPLKQWASGSKGESHEAEKVYNRDRTKATTLGSTAMRMGNTGDYLKAAQAHATAATSAIGTSDAASKIREHKEQEEKFRKMHATAKLIEDGAKMAMKREDAQAKSRR